MPNDRLAELIARTLSGEATPDELQELQYLGEKYPEDQYFLEILSGYWNTPGKIPDNEDLHSDAHFRHIIEAAAKGDDVLAVPAHRRLRRMLAVAAMAAGLVIGGFSYRRFYKALPSDNTIDPKREVAVKSGAKSRLLLPDGTTVWLNSDSKLTYDARFKGLSREVELEGEAFFDVAKNPAHPFIVHTGGIDIRVLGTAFNVKSYPREATFEATLIRGRIEVTKPGEPGGPEIVLHPHEKLVLDKETDSASTLATGSLASAPAFSGSRAAPKMAITRLPGNLPDSSVVETAWIYNKLIFDGETFTSMAAKMERWFNVRINIEDPQVAALRFHVTFDNETIEEVLRSLQVTASFDYIINNDQINIFKKGACGDPADR